MRYLASLILLLLISTPLRADDGFAPLDPTEKEISALISKYFDLCPPRNDETGIAWRDRCLPVDVKERQRKVRVIDGDTIEFDGETIRIANIDAPEKTSPECEAEARLAIFSAEVLSYMTSNLSIKRVGKDKYGRTLAYLRFHGSDVGEMMIKQNAARPYDGGKRQSWCR